MTRKRCNVKFAGWIECCDREGKKSSKGRASPAVASKPSTVSSLHVDTV